MTILNESSNKLVSVNSHNSFDATLRVAMREAFSLPITPLV